MKQKNYIWEILRGLAALMVMFHHYTERYGEEIGHVDIWPLQSLYGGQFGVCMFFIFTGMFLLPSLDKADNFVSYLKKRAFRLYPYYIPCVIVSFLSLKMNIFSIGKEVSWNDFFVNLSMFQSYLGVKNVDGAYWTLSVQSTVYILMGGLFFFLQKKRKPFLFAILTWFIFDLVLSVIEMAFGYVLFSSILIVHTIQLFVQGILIWYISTEREYVYKQISKVVLFLSPLYSFFYFSFIYVVFNFLIVSVIYLITIKKWTYDKKNVFTFLGAISFPMYLLHQNIGFIIIKYMETLGYTDELFVLLPMLVIILLSWVIMIFVEQFLIPTLCKIKKLE